MAEPRHVSICKSENLTIHVHVVLFKSNLPILNVVRLNNLLQCLQTLCHRIDVHLIRIRRNGRNVKLINPCLTSGNVEKRWENVHCLFLV